MSDEFCLHIITCYVRWNFAFISSHVNYGTWKWNPTFLTTFQELPPKWFVSDLNRPGQKLQADPSSTRKCWSIIIQVLSMTVSILMTFSKEKITGNLKSISSFLTQKCFRQQNILKFLFYALNQEKAWPKYCYFLFSDTFVCEFFGIISLCSWLLVYNNPKSLGFAPNSMNDKACSPKHWECATATHCNQAHGAPKYLR